MRTVMNISLQPSIVGYVDKVVSEEGYSTRSEFIRSLIRDHKERQLLNEIEVSREEIKRTGGIKVSSLKDLR